MFHYLTIIELQYEINNQQKILSTTTIFTYAVKVHTRQKLVNIKFSLSDLYFVFLEFHMCSQFLSNTASACADSSSSCRVFCNVAVCFFHARGRRKCVSFLNVKSWNLIPQFVLFQMMNWEQNFRKLRYICIFKITT